MAWAVERIVEQGDEDPRCPECGGITKAATVMFGQALPADELAAAVTAAETCDVYLAVGSSLTVQPAAGLPRLAAEHGARLVVLNAEPTPVDRMATLVVRDPVAAVLPQVVDAVLGGSSSVTP
jgi:NAD-dependent deacetylase